MCAVVPTAVSRGNNGSATHSDGVSGCAALELASRESVDHGFQYVCMLNSDRVPYAEIGPELSIDEHIILRLTDVREDGGLLGFRF
jgi:uncharacterized protein YydD (DUF2326 family)